MMYIQTSCQNFPPYTHKENTHTEILLAMHTYSTMTDNQDSLTFRDKYTALLQQELQNPYWNLHDPITTKSYQISQDMDIETMPHAMYFTGDTDTVTKINHAPYQIIQYNNNGMFTAKLMNDTPLRYLLTMVLHPLLYHYAPIINSLFYTHMPKQKVILLYIQEEV